MRALTIILRPGFSVIRLQQLILSKSQARIFSETAYYILSPPAPHDFPFGISRSRTNFYLWVAIAWTWNNYMYWEIRQLWIDLEQGQTKLFQCVLPRCKSWSDCESMELTCNIIVAVELEIRQVDRLSTGRNNVQYVKKRTLKTRSNVRHIMYFHPS